MPSPSTRPPYLTSTRIAAPHGFFGIHGGVSTGRFSSLNLGAHVGDDPAAVAENRARVAAALGVEPGRLAIIRQVHGAGCVVVKDDTFPDEDTQGDALVTNRPGVAIAVLTADCVPVLFESDNGVIGAAHAGWGGAVKGVLESTLDAMKNLGARNIRAAIGPAIAHASYEVSHGFEKPFVEEDESAVAFFTPSHSEGKWLFDLPGYCAWRLKRAGVSLVDAPGVDTCPENSGYFSHRRATQRGEETPGRQVSAICLQQT